MSADREDVKPLSAAEVVEQLSIYADIAGDEHEEFIIRAALATIDRQAAQLTAAVKVLRWLADGAPECPHEPRHRGSDVYGCMKQVGTEALAAIEKESA